jgi:hypothetical protein
VSRSFASRFGAYWLALAIPCTCACLSILGWGIARFDPDNGARIMSTAAGFLITVIGGRVRHRHLVA